MSNLGKAPSLGFNEHISKGTDNISYNRLYQLPVNKSMISSAVQGNLSCKHAFFFLCQKLSLTWAVILVSFSNELTQSNLPLVVKLTKISPVVSEDLVEACFCKEKKGLGRFGDEPHEDLLISVATSDLFKTVQEVKLQLPAWVRGGRLGQNRASQVQGIHQGHV